VEKSAFIGAFGWNLNFGNETIFCSATPAASLSHNSSGDQAAKLYWLSTL
jgi:hypothetical protein